MGGQGEERSVQELEADHEGAEEGGLGAEEIDYGQGTTHPTHWRSPLTSAPPAYKQVVHKTKMWSAVARRIPRPTPLREVADAGLVVPAPR